MPETLLDYMRRMYPTERRDDLAKHLAICTKCGCIYHLDFDHWLMSHGDTGEE